MITVITPTGDRPVSFALTAEFVLHQVIKESIQWIIIDDGTTPATQQFLFNFRGFPSHVTIDYHYRTPMPEKETGKFSPKSLAANLLEAIPRVRGEYVFIMEDDDWYSPLYFHDGLEKLKTYNATGPIWQCYYNLEQLTYKVLKNKGSSLCSTCFKADLLPIFREVCRTCYGTNFKGIDYSFWKELDSRGICTFIDEAHRYLCVGMKSLPGRKGIGIGHEGRKFYPDPEGKKLREWVGEAWANRYLEIRHDMLRH